MAVYGRAIFDSWQRLSIYISGRNLSMKSSGFLAEMSRPLQMAKWNQIRQVPSDKVIDDGITVLLNSTDQHLVDCASTFVTALENTYHIHANLKPNKSTWGLISCENKCVEIDVGLR